MTTDLSPMTAVADILWLQKRFQGILDLAAKLEDVAALESYSAELAASTQTLKAENAKLLGVKLDLEAAVKAANEEASAAVANAEAKVSKILSDAKAEAESQRLAARESAAAEVVELQTQKLQKQKEVSDLTSKASALEATIDEQQKAHDKLVAMINELKAKF